MLKNKPKIFQWDYKITFILDGFISFNKRGLVVFIEVVYNFLLWLKFVFQGGWHNACLCGTVRLM